MIVLFINGREDGLESPGGDTIQMCQTMTKLQSMGITVIESCLTQIDDCPEVDIAHVFNIQMPESAWKIFEALERKNKPIVLSSIFWDMYEHWCELASKNVPLWRLINRTIGKSNTSKIYTKWQRTKAPKNSQWQIQKRLLEHANRVLPNSLSEAKLLKNTFQLDDAFLSKVTVVPNGIDPTLFDPKPDPWQDFYQQYGIKDFVLQVGSIHPVKNQLGLIEALFDLPVQIVFIGKVNPKWTDYADQCKTLSDHRGDVIFCERVPHEQLPGIYALAAVHALPSWRETPGLVSLEAAAAGCKVVTTSIGSTYDYFKDEVWYCHPNDLGSIRKAVESALQAPPSNKLREEVLTNYTWQHAAEATLAAYEETLN